MPSHVILSFSSKTRLRVLFVFQSGMSTAYGRAFQILKRQITIQLLRASTLHERKLVEEDRSYLTIIFEAVTYRTPVHEPYMKTKQVIQPNCISMKLSSSHLLALATALIICAYASPTPPTPTLNQPSAGSNLSNISLGNPFEYWHATIYHSRRAGVIALLPNLGLQCQQRPTH